MLATVIRSRSTMLCRCASAPLLSHAQIALPPTVTLGGSSPTRSMGIMDTIRGYTESSATKASASKRADMFSEQLAFLSSAPVYGLEQHCALLTTLAEKAGVNGWRTMLLSDAQKSDLAEQLIDLKIGEGFSPAERADTRNITPAVKARVAASLGTVVPRVNRFLEGFQQSSVVHKWLQTRKSKGDDRVGGEGVLLRPSFSFSRPAHPSSAAPSCPPQALRSLVHMKSMRRPWSLIASVRARVARNSVARWARLARIKPRSESFRVSSPHDCVHHDDTAMSFARRCHSPDAAQSSSSSISTSASR
jgi:hypothetical protein